MRKTLLYDVDRVKVQLYWLGDDVALLVFLLCDRLLEILRQIQNIRRVTAPEIRLVRFSLFLCTASDDGISQRIM